MALTRPLFHFWKGKCKLCRNTGFDVIPVSCLLVEEFCPFLKALGWDWSCCKQEHEVWFHKEVASHKVSILRNRRLAAIIITRDSRRWASPT